ncbi:MAG TPA: YbaK/EbsC family protein [Solirubrobacteraceae bacterium]|nr:YbaK/EbsC family protein [Solirubrobacteraceae bacterium]
MVVVDTHERLLSLLEAHGAEYRLIDHQPEGRTVIASALRGHSLREAAKCLVLRVNAGQATSRYVLAVVPGDRRVDVEAIKALFGATSVGFARREVAERLAGCVSGSVLPFSLHSELELVVDPEVLDVPTLYFNAARLDRSIGLRAEDYARIARPRLAPIALRESPSLAA